MVESCNEGWRRRQPSLLRFTVCNCIAIDLEPADALYLVFVYISIHIYLRSPNIWFSYAPQIVPLSPTQTRSAC